MGLKGLVFVSSILMLYQTYYAENCCHKKVVREPPEDVGTYTFVKRFDGEKDDNCVDSCIYRKDTGPSENQYCFKAVNIGAATIDDQCDVSSSEDSSVNLTSSTTGALTTAPPTPSDPTVSTPSTGSSGDTITAPPTSGAQTISPSGTGAPTTSGDPTTGALTTGVLTSGDPTTGAPTSVAPTTGALTTGAPTSTAPTSTAPTYIAQKTATPTTGTPTTSAPTIVSKDNLLEILPKWGEYFEASLQMWVESFSGPNIGEWSEFLRFTSTENDSGSPGDRIPAIFVNKGGYIGVRSQVGENTNFAKNINIQAKVWIKVEVKQYPENGEVIDTTVFFVLF